MKYLFITQPDPGVLSRLEQDPHGTTRFFEQLTQRFHPEMAYQSVGAKLTFLVVDLQDPAELAELASLLTTTYLVYPDVYPVTTLQEYQQMLQRLSRAIGAARPAA